MPFYALDAPLEDFNLIQTQKLHEGLRECGGSGYRYNEYREYNPGACTPSRRQINFKLNFTVAVFSPEPEILALLAFKQRCSHAHSAQAHLADSQGQ